MQGMTSTRYQCFANNVQQEFLPTDHLTTKYKSSILYYLAIKKKVEEKSDCVFQCLMHRSRLRRIINAFFFALASIFHRCFSLLLSPQRDQSAQAKHGIFRASFLLSATQLHNLQGNCLKTLESTASK